MILLGCRINTYLQTQSFRCIGLLDEIIHSKLIFKLHQLVRWSTGTTFSALFERFAVAWAPQVVGGGQGDWVSARYTPPPYTYIHRPYTRALLTKITTFTLPSYKCQPVSQHHQHINQHRLTSVISQVNVNVSDNRYHGSPVERYCYPKHTASHTSN